MPLNVFRVVFCFCFVCFCLFVVVFCFCLFVCLFFGGKGGGGEDTSYNCFAMFARSCTLSD